MQELFVKLYNSMAMKRLRILEPMPGALRFILHLTGGDSGPINVPAFITILMPVPEKMARRKQPKKGANRGVARGGRKFERRFSRSDCAAVPRTSFLEVVLTTGTTLYGRIADTNGKPVERAMIRNVQSSSSTVQCCFHGSRIWQTESDAEGRFIWEDSPKKQVILSIKKSGYYEKRVEITPDPETGYEIVLPARFGYYTHCLRCRDQRAGEQLHADSRFLLLMGRITLFSRKG